MHLKAGDPVTIVREFNNSLSIIPNPERTANSANEVTAIVSQNESGSSLKRKVVSDLIIIQVLLRIPELSVDSAVRRMFLISTAMHTDEICVLIL
jgi:hypothetical protein